RIDEIDADEDIALVSTHDDVSTQDNIVQDEGIKDVGVKEIVEVVTTAKMSIDAVVDVAQVTTTIVDIPVSAAKTIVTTGPTITTKSTKTNVKVTQAPKTKGVMIQDTEETTTTNTASSQQPQVQDKGKRKEKIIKEPVKLKKKDQIFFNEEAKMDADYQLAERMQAEEQQELNKEEKTKLFMKFMEKIRKFFAAKRADEKRNKPRSKKDKVTKDSLKRTREELEQESDKNQNMEDDKESTELKQCLEIIPDDRDNITINVHLYLLRFFYILIAPKDQDKTTFTCPYGTFAYRRMLFGLCNASATFKRYMTAIFHDMVEDFMEVFMDDISGIRNISSRSEIPQNNIQVKAQVLPTNDACVVIKFLRRLFARFGVIHKLSSAYHPQTNGQTEVTNRAIKHILEISVGYNSKNWFEKLDDALWALRIAYKTPTGCTPFRLVYRKAFHLPVEIEDRAYWALKQCVTTEMPITTAKKAQRRLDVKTRSTLMMGIFNEHQLKFNSIKDAKKLLEAVEKRFGRNVLHGSTPPFQGGGVLVDQNTIDESWFSSSERK
nr:hypothetical protein [Tanacetum cinerariifolium]